ncbi:uncharacterized protein EHS24_005761 [Apiotrichum porosum]|uniref:DUF676 domain-containing protein n=1 Tax=Apiotrichum porosum TaxID=105984 RepID=A0A427XZI2_9TREE|nr:uncharacterized protein EHS24_005761 [Apiotrichum porosum]RSH84249.1 hypothetical protein EHS24_005761 [Apiotrichum porosum]
MTTSKDVHLFLLIHGLWAARTELEAAWAASLGDDSAAQTPPDNGSPLITPAHSPDAEPTNPFTHTHSFMPQAPASAGEELVVVVAEGMTSQLTYDGIDVCASRVAWEVDQHVARLEADGRRVAKFSVMGYSLGGLVARYLVGLLNARSPSFFNKHAPVSFTTIATPHLGIPRYNTFLSVCVTFLGSKLLSRSGNQIHVVDKYSKEDPRPVLEIMADPKQVFHKGLAKFDGVHIYASVVNDATVPYPSAAIETSDHFAQWAERGLKVAADEAGIVSDWYYPVSDKKLKKKWAHKMGTLPPTLRFRWPLNYIILALFPLLVPLLFILIVLRFSLDTTRSRLRLQGLARTGTPHNAEHKLGADIVSPIPSPNGMGIDALRNAIRAVERNLEQDLIQAAEYDFGLGDTSSAAIKTIYKPGKHQYAMSSSEDSSYEDDDADTAPLLPLQPTVLARLTDPQLRMAYYLNQLQPIKHLAWFPDVANSHAVIIVRDPGRFPVHERGRGVLKHWARVVTHAAVQAQGTTH